MCAMAKQFFGGNIPHFSGIPPIFTYFLTSAIYGRFHRLLSNICWGENVHMCDGLQMEAGGCIWPTVIRNKWRLQNRYELFAFYLTSFHLLFSEIYHIQYSDFWDYINETIISCFPITKHQEEHDVNKHYKQNKK